MVVSFSANLNRTAQISDLTEVNNSINKNIDSVSDIIGKLNNLKKIENAKKCKKK